MAIQIEYELDILDISARLNDDSVVILEPSSGLNIVYGRNGAGKSSLINALAGADSTVTLILRAPNHDKDPGNPSTIWEEVLDEFDWQCQQIYGVEYLSERCDEIFERHTPLEHWSHLSESPSPWDPIRYSLRLKEKGLKLALGAVKTAQEKWSKAPDLLVDELDADDLAKFRKVINHWFASTENYIQSRRSLPPRLRNFRFTDQEDRESLFDSVRNELNEAILAEVVPRRRDRTDEHLDDSDDTDDIFTELTTLSSGKEILFRAGSLTDVVGETGITAAEVLVAFYVSRLRNKMDADVIDDLDELLYNQEFFENWSGPMKNVFDDAEVIVEDFEIGLTELLDCDHIAVQFLAEKRERKWSASYAIRFPETAADGKSEATQRFLHRLRTCLSSQEDGVSTPDGIAGALYLGALNMHQLDRTLSDQPKYIILDPPQAAHPTIPFTIVNLDKEVDLDEIARRLTLLAVRDATILIQPGEDDEPVIEMPNKGFVDEMIAEFTRIVRTLDLGLTEVFLDLDSSAEAILTRRAPQLRFAVENHPHKRLGFSRLSFAQQRWVRIVLNILMRIHDPNNPVLFVSDEPEIGVHQGAARQVLEYLASMEVPTVISSHSALSFQVRGAKLLHLGATASGVRYISEPIFSENVAEVAEGLGVTPLDLLALKKLLVVGEGEHDVAVFEGLLGLDLTSKLSQRVLLTAARGAKNLLSTTETKIITDYTDLQVLHVADNVSSERVKVVADRLRSELLAGAPVNRALKESGLVELRQNATFEERVLYDLLERCAQRRLMDRFRVFGMSKRDIVEYLPAGAFGLDALWEELREEHAKVKSAGGERDFKEWLRREKNASISARKIKTAFDQLDELHADLKSLLLEFEVLTAVSSLR
jgi:energy-coupling factor transporter ATP-binding protein EcfA2